MSCHVGSLRVAVPESGMLRRIGGGIPGLRREGRASDTLIAVDASLRRALVEAVGPDAVLQDGSMLAPATADGVSDLLRIAEDRRLPVRLTSGAGEALIPPEGGAVLSLARLAALSLDASSGVVRAEAGVTLTALASSLADAGVAVVGLGADPGSEHVGALVARGEVPRRSLTGIEAVLPGGDLIQFGGAVLKDVVGYDIASLLLGSRGRLAAIIAVHLRLVPAAAAVEVAEPAGTRDVGELTGVFDPEGILVGG
jgi:FAD/FMN-containing dehydrogenase